jgi:acrylyl-CoA reductase (NADPH)
LGAATIVPRAELEAKPSGPLASERWSGAVDNVGGPILANLLAALKRNASCASVGLAASNKLDTTVVPFLLRGVNLLGIDSSMTPFARRVAAWNRLDRDFDWALPIASPKRSGSRIFRPTPIVSSRARCAAGSWWI